MHVFNKIIYNAFCDCCRELHFDVLNTHLFARSHLLTYVKAKLLKLEIQVRSCPEVQDL